MNHLMVYCLMTRSTRTAKVRHKLGLHARPAALFVQLANTFKSDVTVRKGRQSVNGKSIMGILMLGAEKGSIIVIEADGDDAHLAIVELEKIISDEEGI